MAIPPGLLLDGASGLVLIAFGVLALLVRSRQPVATGFGIFAIAFGLRAAVANFTNSGRDALGSEAVLWVTLVCYWVAAPALVWAGWKLVPPSVRTRGALLTIAFTGVMPALAYFATTPYRDITGLGRWGTVHTVVGAQLAALPLIALALPREPDPRARRTA